jgi:hypothetical protein
MELDANRKGTEKLRYEADIKRQETVSLAAARSTLTQSEREVEEIRVMFLSIQYISIYLLLSM